MAPNSGVPLVTTPRLRLRDWIDGDVDTLYHIMSQPDLMQYFPRPTAPPRDAVARLIAAQGRYWADYGYGWWAVERRSDGVLMGWCGLQYLPETDETEVGFLLGREFWNQGYATEAALVSLTFGFERFPLAFIVGIVHPDNGASRRVLEKIGMQVTREDEYFGMHCLRYAIERDAYEQSGLQRRIPLEEV